MRRAVCIACCVAVVAVTAWSLWPNQGTAEPKPQNGDREILGFRTLTLCAIDRRLIAPELLTADERSWLDAYHARVLSELHPLVEDARGWLERACAPLA